MFVRAVLALTFACCLAVPRLVTAHAATPAFSHVYVVMLENTNYEDVIGNTADAPYINSLAQTEGFAANYYGVTHPSLPNYIAATAGDFFGTHSDSPTQTFKATNIVDQLESKGYTWAAYMQDMPSVGFTGAQYPANGSGLYVIKHNPFQLFTDVSGNATREQHIKPADQLAADLATGSAPNFVWISPDQCHDMHGVSPPSATAYGLPWCGYPPNFAPNHALIQQGDAYVKQLVATIMGSKAWTADSAIVVTWDENESSGLSTPNRGYASSTGCCGSPTGEGGGRVPAIVVTSAANHIVSLRPYNHYSLLLTVENNFGLGCLANTCNTAVTPMTDLFTGTGTSIPLSQTQGFAVTFSSSAPGQGMVLFGPSCNALVETATNDLSAGTTTHTVLVTGNDLPGTIGNVGLTPGTTYAYEAETVTPNGVQIDNNGGNCYYATISKQG
ncbi:MAG TPA: alkaline phosphatase family protein [Chloroflexota bacterium]